MPVLSGRLFPLLYHNLCAPVIHAVQIILFPDFQRQRTVIPVLPVQIQQPVQLFLLRKSRAVVFLIAVACKIIQVNQLADTLIFPE